jgi:hypothetical protein
MKRLNECSHGKIQVNASALPSSTQRKTTTFSLTPFMITFPSHPLLMILVPVDEAVQWSTPKSSRLRLSQKNASKKCNSEWKTNSWTSYYWTLLIVISNSRLRLEFRRGFVTEILYPWLSRPENLPGPWQPLGPNSFRTQTKKMWWANALNLSHKKNFFVHDLCDKLVLYKITDKAARFAKNFPHLRVVLNKR